MNLSDAERLLDLGRLEMQTPGGAWVPARRARRRWHHGRFNYVLVMIEGSVIASISEKDDVAGQPYLREADRSHVIARGVHLDGGCCCRYCAPLVERAQREAQA